MGPDSVYEDRQKEGLSLKELILSVSIHFKALRKKPV